MTRATKIVATLGPASSSPEILRAMIQAGVDVVRLNFSHGVAQDHRDRANLIRQISLELGREIAIMADLQGPKIRVGKFESGKVQLVTGAKFILDAECQIGNHERAGLDYKDLPKDVRAGDQLLLNDGLIVLRVEKVDGPCIYTQVEMGGDLSNNKGINRAGGGLTAPALTDKDQEDLLTAIDMGVDYIAISFPKNADDMHFARKLAHSFVKDTGQDVRLIAKIERAEATYPGVLEGIIQASDGIMVARGDLAVEVGNASVPALQKRMIRLANQADKFVITATQMMESMIDRVKPNRSEITDVANAVIEGADAVMLSGETATGQFPVLVIETMRKIISEVEQNGYKYNRSEDLKPQPHSPSFLSDALCYSACRLSDDSGSQALVGMTQSGYTAFMLSSFRPKSPLFVFTKEASLVNQLSLSWGVKAFYYDKEESLDAIFTDQIQLLKKDGYVKEGDIVVNTGSTPIKLHMPTNMIKINKVD